MMMLLFSTSLFIGSYIIYGFVDLRYRVDVVRTYFDRGSGDRKFYIQFFCFQTYALSTFTSATFWHGLELKVWGLVNDS